MNCLLLHPEGWSPAPLAPALETALVEARAIRGPAELVPEERPTVFLFPADVRAAFPVDALRAFVDAGGAIVAVGAAGEPDVPETLPTELLSSYVPYPGGVRQLLVAVRTAYQEVAARTEAVRQRHEATQRGHEVAELTGIGTKLMTERDPDKLLDDILTQARRLTQSDAGSLYLVEPDSGSDNGKPSSGAPDGPDSPPAKCLRFRLAQNFTLPNVPLVQFTMPLDRTSLAGYAAVTGDPLVIDNAYDQQSDVEYTINRSFDERSGYCSRSMLVIPMKNHKGEVIGVLQLINRKRDPEARLATMADVERQVVHYSKRTVELVTALAGHAAVSIENSQLYEQIEQMFEGFVDAAVQAIEQRDPVTQGHSRRVATSTVSLAKAVDRVGLARFTREQIDEIKYAGLLHDFGKVGVREHVLTKAKKLYPDQLELIRQRHAFVQRTLERDFWRQRAEFLEQHGSDGYGDFVARLDERQRAELEQLDRFIRVVLQANEPSILPSESVADLTEFGRRTYLDLSDQPRPLLTEREVRFLTIRKGSLDEEERKQIEDHVTQSYRFLYKIPWTTELKKIPDIAYGHHELIDGTGYPRKIAGDEIPTQTRMMTISDIYDALTAQDRPYKKAVPPTRALDIMDQELVRTGQLDAKLFQVFVEAKVFLETGP